MIIAVPVCVQWLPKYRITKGASDSESDLDKYRKVLDTNVIAPAICAREYVKSAKKRNIAGHIINLNSIAGHYAEVVANPIGMYGASKYALTALAVELRHELTDVNIKVTNISPGAVMTDMLKGFVDDPAIVGKLPTLSDNDVSDAVMYALGTPQHLEVIDVLLQARNTSGSLREALAEMQKKRNKN